MRHRWILAVLLAVLVLATIVSGCLDRASDRVVDGWPVGGEVGYGTLPRWDELATAASAGLDRRNPGHAAAVRMTLHLEGTVVDPLNGSLAILATRSGSCCWVMLFELEDGSARAIGVGYPGISREAVAVDYGP